MSDARLLLDICGERMTGRGRVSALSFGQAEPLLAAVGEGGLRIWDLRSGEVTSDRPDARFAWVDSMDDRIVFHDGSRIMAFVPGSSPPTPITVSGLPTDGRREVVTRPEGGGLALVLQGPGRDFLALWSVNLRTCSSTRLNSELTADELVRLGMSRTARARISFHAAALGIDGSALAITSVSSEGGTSYGSMILRWNPGGERLTSVRLSDVAGFQTREFVAGAILLHPSCRWAVQLSSSALLIDLATGEVVRRFACPQPSTDVVTGGAFVAGGMHLIAIHSGGLAKWDVETGALLQSRAFDAKFATSFQVSERHGLLAFHRQETVQIHSLEDFSTVEFHRPGHRSPIIALALCRRGRSMATSDEQSVKVWQASTGELLWSRAGSTQSLAFSPDGRRLALIANNRWLILDAETGEVLVSADTEGTGNIQWCEDGRLFCLSLQEATRLRLLEGEDPRLTAETNVPFTQAAELSEDGRCALILTGERVIAWDLVSKSRLWDEDAGAIRIAIAPEGHLAAIVSYQTMADIRILDVASGKDVCSLGTSGDDDEGSHVGALAFGRGNRVAVGFVDGTVTVHALDTQSNTSSSSLVRAPAVSPINALVFSQDGSRLAAGCADGSVRLWHLAP